MKVVVLVGRRLRRSRLRIIFIKNQSINVISRMIENNNTEIESKKLFNAFRRIDNIDAPERKIYDKIVLQLLFDEEGAYLVVVDKNGQKLDADYRIYHGAIRDLLKTLNSAQSKQDDFIGWDSDTTTVFNIPANKDDLS